MIELLYKSIRKTARKLTDKVRPSGRICARICQRLKARCKYQPKHPAHSEIQFPLLPLQHRTSIQVHLHETEHYFYVWVEVPGMSRRDLSIRVIVDRLSIEGCKKNYTMETNDPLQRVELTYAGFEKIITLPCPVDADQTDVRCEKGMLNLKLTKSTPDNAL